MSKSSNSNNLDDKASKYNPPNSDNPFVRFRHFADEQVGSILQGFIGLPSVFRKSQSNSPWSVFDEDLKRRDELQARRETLKEQEKARSEDRRTPHDVEKFQSSVKKLLPSHIQMDVAQFPHWRTNLFERHDIPLYSPLHSPFTVFEDLRHSMGSFAALDSSAALMSYRFDLNHVSLVPYLFASPYSPLNLSVNGSVVRDFRVMETGKSSGTVSRDNFPYWEAFEDLLLTTQGRDKEALLSRRKLNDSETSEHINLDVRDGFGWIDRLQKLGILHLPKSDLQGTPNRYPLSRPEGAASDQELIPHTPRVKNVRKDAETEEQMYENFLNDASTTSERFFTTLESTLTAVEKIIRDKNLSVERSRQASSSDVEEVNLSGNSTSEPTESKREVSSTSTVETYTDEDGGVRTIVRVSKRFADGSTTETESSHTIVKTNSQRADFDSEGWISEMAQQNDNQDKESRIKKKTKSGWFWS